MGWLTDKALGAAENKGSHLVEKVAYEETLRGFAAVKQATIDESNEIDRLRQAGAPAHVLTERYAHLDGTFVVAIGAAKLALARARAWFPHSLPLLHRKGKLRQAEDTLMREISLLETARRFHQDLSPS